MLPSLTSVLYRDLPRQQDALRRQTSANLRTLSINIISPLRIHFPLLNPAELCHYQVICIILLPRITFSLAFVMYTFSARLLQAARCWQAIK
jgi:hypothetical protein